MTTEVNESVTDMVIRLVARFKRGPTSKEREEVVSEIISLPPNRSAIIALRMFQQLSPDNYLTGVLCRTTYPSREKRQPVSYKSHYRGVHYEIGYDGSRNRFWYVAAVLSSGPIHYSRESAEEMLKLEIDKRLDQA